MNDSNIRFPRWGSCIAVVLLGFIAACNHSGDDNAAPGTASVSLTDAPACGYEVVNVTVRKVRIHQSSSANDNDAGWTDITLNPPRTINLLDLNDPTQPNFALEHLGETPLPAGHYTQLRLVLEDNNGNQPTANWIVLEGQNPNNPNNRIPLETPSAIKSGLKLVHQFTVGSGQRVDLLLDFDACNSIVQTGNGTYKLKPVIKVIPFVLNGIDGFVDPTLLGSNVVVSAQTNGEIVRVTRPNSTTAKFFLARLTPGIPYTVVITAAGHVTKVITGVPVPSETSVTDVSTAGAPITLGTSATHTVSGTVTLNPATDDETVFVAAKQMFGSDLLTVKVQPAQLVDGPPAGDFSYSLTLPTAAPLLGAYSTPLPITFTAQSGIAGQYTIQASAEGYAAQSFNKDVSAADQTQNFTLVP
jgi:Domain of unknown function (DUF4382)